MKSANKVGIVTGAGRGIGEAIVHALAKQGVNVVINDINPESAENVVKEIKALGFLALAIKADVSNAEEVQQMVIKTINQFGKIDILVNNAVYSGRFDSFIDSSEEEWEKHWKVDLKGVFLCCKAVLRHMIDRRSGCIVNIASSSGKIGGADAVYSALKGGVITFTKALARQVAPYNIRVNSVAPGPTLTLVAIERKEYYDRVKDFYLSTIPLRRYGEPRDIANMVAFLVSDDASYITGQCFSVDGGRTMI